VLNMQNVYKFMMKIVRKIFENFQIS
jgi:hypothetical protein